MIFTPTPLPGAYVVEMQPIEDERGFFARLWCAREFTEHGLTPDMVQCNYSYNIKKGTLRGMHFQTTPHEEAKFVRCVQGSIFDVIVDIRPGSPTYGKWFGQALAATDLKLMYVPKGFSHGYQTLEDQAAVLYLISTAYAPAHSSGHHHADPSIGIPWPLEVSVISEKDAALAFLGSP